MKMYMFSIYDEVAQVYSEPFYAVNCGVAQRYFSDALKQVDEQYRNEYELMILGKWNNSNGMVDSFATPLKVSEFEVVSNVTSEDDTYFVDSID